MSGYSGNPGESNNIDSLVNQLRENHQNNPPSLEPSYSYYNNGGYFGQGPPVQQPHGYHQPYVQSVVPTPLTGQQPHHSSAIMSPVETSQSRPATGGGAPSVDRSKNLLNLLKFSGPSTTSSVQTNPINRAIPPSREPSASYGSDTIGMGSPLSQGNGGDLLATLMGSMPAKPTQQASPQFAQAPHSSFGSGATSAETQAYLLQLLNQPKPPQTDSTPQMKPAKVFTPPSKASSQEDVEELTQALDDTSLSMNMMGSSATESAHVFRKENTREPASKTNPQGLFTYTNPFEQLAASSPRNRTPKNEKAGPSSSPAIQILKREVVDNKRKIDGGNMSSPAHAKRKLELASQASSSAPTPLPDGRSQLEALIGIGASGNKETVHDALNEVGDQVDKQVQEAIAKVERDEAQASIEEDLREMLAAKTEREFEENAQIAAQSIKKELEKEENADALHDLPPQVAEAVKDIVDDTAHGHIADSWESADADDSLNKDEDTDNIIPVYNFPMRPWTSIALKDAPEELKQPLPVFRNEAVMDIARLKKEFDQVDRTLVTASNNFIVYGMSKAGGIRIIRQDDGKDAKLFTETHDRIFSVVISASSADQKESIIGTGISGTVYWALIKDGEGDHIEDSNPEMYGFALQPIQVQESEPSPSAGAGGVLKTRARKSSAHPDYFAVGRGKYIHIIWPSVIMKSFLKNGKDRIVDTEKYLSKHSLKINTTKAGKDFIFSEDDTTIVSLDKAGKVKFWDIRTLTKTDILGAPSHPQEVEIKEPLLTLITTPDSHKAWPTSVLLVDKVRPYQRGGALRYLLVGMKQNHTLQLWDLALSRAVQEINLPHSKESDAVCSVLYHAATSMIVVGHPTRNSIYFLHLSAPKYNLPKNMNQAEYMKKVVARDPSVFKPDSTAVISGMREYTLENKGTLRSLDILPTPNSANAANSEPSTLFELYAMHSKGVTCLNIKQADLGWSSDNKVVNPIDAEKEANIINISTLKEVVQPPLPEVVQPVPAVWKTTKETTLKESPSKPSPRIVAAESSTPAIKLEEEAEALIMPVTNGGGPSAAGGSPEKAEKKRRKKATSEASVTRSKDVVRPIVLDPSSNTRHLSHRSQASVDIAPSQQSSDATIKGIEDRVSSEVTKLFSSSLDTLYHNIREDRRAQTLAMETKQEAMLRIISSTLSENIEVTLGRIVTSEIEKLVIPAVSATVSKAANDQLGVHINNHLSQNLASELGKVLPDAVSKALMQPQLLKLMSESLAKTVAFRVEEQFAGLLQNVVTPAFSQLAVQTSQKVAGDIHRQATEQIRAIERQHQSATVKIEQLTQLVTGLTETISSMAAAQTDFQGQFLRMQQQAAMDRRQIAHTNESNIPRGSVSSAALTAPAPMKSPGEIEYEAMLSSIQALMSAGDYENAVIQWLQTRREQEFFRRYFSRFEPNFVRDLSPLLLLSLGATISLELTDDLLVPRISWMEMILATFQGHVGPGLVR